MTTSSRCSLLRSLRSLHAIAHPNEAVKNREIPECSFGSSGVTSITNGVRANEHPVKLQTLAGHASFQTTQRYIALAANCSMTRWRHSRSGCSAFLPILLPDSHHLT